MILPVVEVAGLAHRYPDGVEALRGLDFRIHPGERVALVGANGAGKSTLLQHLNGTLMPSAGGVRIRGEGVARASLRSVRRAVGMVFQDPDDQLFMSTVAEDVAFGPRNQGLPEVEVQVRVARVLAQVGLESLARRTPHHLSAGEKRRAALATVLSMDPEILVLDEPSSGLDPRARRHLITLLAGLGCTQLIATHDLDLALDLCERTLVLRQGRLEADGPTREIFADRALLEACHLEAPLRLQGCPRCGESTI